mmetsp:Transcript_25413/g.63744  ORF Transcript_25413/g.63744 Transcript_25413/m.63744 type:complete len:101 (-) Transcript_25413:359-661(-)
MKGIELAKAIDSLDAAELAGLCELVLEEHQNGDVEDKPLRPHITWSAANLKDLVGRMIEFRYFKAEDWNLEMRGCTRRKEWANLLLKVCNCSPSNSTMLV